MARNKDPLGAPPAKESSPFDVELDDDDEVGGFDMSLDDEETVESDEPKDVKVRARTSRALVDETIAERRRRERAALDRLDMGFFFSVVFQTRVERDAWLEAHGLKLRADDYLLPDELEDALKR